MKPTCSQAPLSLSFHTYVLHQLTPVSARPWSRHFRTLAPYIFPAPSGYYFPPLTIQHLRL